MMADVASKGFFTLKHDLLDGICLRMSRPLFSLLIAIAMLFAPLAMRSGTAMAMAQTAEHHAMVESGHCGEHPAKKDSQPDDKSNCVAMCSVIAVAPLTPIEPHALAATVERPALVQFDHSFLAELPTPPPRLV